MPGRAGLSLLICLFAASPARGQAPLTVGAAMAEAAEANPTLRQARASVDRSAADVTIARSAWFPRLTFSESWQRGTSPLFAFSSLLGARRFQAADFAIDRLNRPGAISAFGTRVSISQTVFDGGHARATTNAARRARDVAAAELGLAEADVALSVVRAYGQILAADAAGRAAASAVTAAEEDLRRAERRRDAGTVTDADVLAISVHLADARQQAISAAGDAAISRAELNRLTGAAVDRSFSTVEPPLPDVPAADLPTLLLEAEAARPEIRRAAAAEDLSRQQLRAARAAWAPSVAVRAGVDTVGLSFTERANSWMAAGEVTWSLSLGGAEAARSRAASASVDAARAARDAARAAVHVDVVAALRRLEAARARVALGDQAVLAAREAHRILRNRYDNGLAAAADVLRAATAELDALGARSRAFVDAMVADAELRRALGRPVASGFQ